MLLESARVLFPNISVISEINAKSVSQRNILKMATLHLGRCNSTQRIILVSREMQQ